MNVVVHEGEDVADRKPKAEHYYFPRFMSRDLVAKLSLTRVLSFRVERRAW